MAIYAHEGLPRSGKSYEAAVYIILVALMNKRKVWAYVEGLNHEKFAELAGISIEECRELLIQLTYDDVKNIPERSELEKWRDGWVVIDEIQDFYPAGSKIKCQKTSKFITQHGHDGLDILIMGQSMMDVNVLWRNRITQKTQFLKRDAVNKAGSYLWTTYKGRLNANGKITFEKIRSGIKEYESKYFGLYKSHSAGTSNTGNHSDDRANIFKSGLFTKVIPLTLIAVFLAIYWLYDFFHTPPTAAAAETVKTQKVKPKPVKKLPQQKKQETKKEPEKYQPVDYVDQILNKYKARLAGYIKSDTKTIGRFDFLDSADRVHEVLTFSQVKQMGWDIQLKSDYVILTKNNLSHTITSWPIDSFASVSDYKIDRMTPNNNNVASTTSAATTGSSRRRARTASFGSPYDRDQRL